MHAGDEALADKTLDNLGQDMPQMTMQLVECDGIFDSSGVFWHIMGDTVQTTLTRDTAYLLPLRPTNCALSTTKGDGESLLIKLAYGDEGVSGL
jgi:hypothetical protein